MLLQRISFYECNCNKDYLEMFMYGASRQLNDNLQFAEDLCHVTFLDQGLETRPYYPISLIFSICLIKWSYMMRSIWV